MLDRLDRYQKTARRIRADAKRTSRLSEGDALVVRDLTRRIRRDVLEEIAAERAAQQMAEPQP